MVKLGVWLLTLFVALAFAALAALLWRYACQMRDAARRQNTNQDIPEEPSR